MKIRCLLPLLAAIALSWLFASTASATTYISYTGGSAALGAATGSGLAIGREFTVSGNGITVSDLGVWDYQNDGLLASHTVSLFSLSGLGIGVTGTPIANGSVVVPAGTGATLDSGFRFQSLSSPIYLAAGNYAEIAYGMTGKTPTGGDPYGDGGNIPSGVPDVVHGGYDPYQFNVSGTTGFPTGGDSNNHSSVSFHFTSTDSPPPSAGGLKIMPLGDSITDGVDGTDIAGYRGPLNTLLNTAGIQHQFVGSCTDTPGNLPADQQHHEGHSGFTIQGGGRSGLLDPGNISSWLGPSGPNPDVILLMIGTNDVTTYATTLATVPQATANMATLIDKISNPTTGLDPHAKLIIAKITPMAGSYATYLPEVQAFNDSLAGLVAQYQNVSLVDMYSALNPSTDVASDGLHPNDSGYNKMAQVWLNGIEVAVPEPSTFILLGVGAIGLFAYAWRRRRQAS